MRTYHQCGHNFIWNIQSVREDDSGSGLIVSPVNVQANRLPDRIPEDVRRASFMDPQFYLPHDPRGSLSTYPFFPGIVLGEFSTVDFEAHTNEVARDCLAFQQDLGFAYAVIPSRYYEDFPEHALSQATALFVDPFIAAHGNLGHRPPLLLTLIAKPIHLQEGIERSELVSWATSFPEVAGIYLLFDNNFYTKQIKEPDYLAGQLELIHDLRMNDLEVHVGYSNTEGLLLSAADPTSVAMGSYENLRSFGVQRLETRERTARRGPRPRIYSGRLLQWIEDTFFPPIRELVEGWEDLIENSPYKAYLLNPSSALNFQRAEIYKHAFWVYSRQVATLPPVGPARNEHIRARVSEALGLFEEIRAARVFLDSDSDGSHLPAWMNALAMYEARVS